jgi:hypothetical protein
MRSSIANGQNAGPIDIVSKSHLLYCYEVFLLHGNVIFFLGTHLSHYDMAKALKLFSSHSPPGLNTW